MPDSPLHPVRHWLGCWQHRVSSIFSRRFVYWRGWLSKAEVSPSAVIQHPSAKPFIFEFRPACVLRKGLYRKSHLGRDVVIGRRVWDVQGKVRIIIGPVDCASLRSLLPSGDARHPLSSLVRLYLGLELDAEIQVVLAPEAVPWAALEYDEVDGPRLGWNAWIRTHNFGQPVGDLRFEVA